VGLAKAKGCVVTTSAEHIADLLQTLLGRAFPLRVRAWDGSEAGPVGSPKNPVLVVRSRRALRRLLWSPDEVGFGRAWVSGDITVDGDLETALRALGRLEVDTADRGALSSGQRVDLFRTALRLGAIGRPPQPPPEEVRLSGRRHSKGRDAAAIAHHYDVSNEFYELVLGESMVYSCAYWAHERSPAYGLAEAQRDKLELVSRKLGLRPGMRLLDVGCGWGAFVIHAAREHGVRAVGITLSRAQAEWARKRVAEEGLDALVEIREQDWRDVDDGPYDAIASIGMAEHVGAAGYPDYVRTLYTLLAPRGRLLNHQIVEPPGPRSSGRSFIDAYVFPDGELLPIGDVVSLIEGGGFEVRDVENLREHYARTLRCWVDNLTKQRDAALRAASAGRVRVWQLYMTGSALSFDSGQIGVAQVLAVRRARDGDSGMPATRADFLLAR